MKQLVRFFTCAMTGDKCAVIFDGKDEICVTEDEGYDVYAQSMARYDNQHLVNEMY